VKLQIAGLNTGYDRVVTRGAAPGPVSFWYYQGDTLLAVDAANDPRGYMVGKRLIEAGKSPDAAFIADAETDLKSLLTA
jgi:3-phenylpropionate/trans-cinnamate dioxygenase ferredoxin reductase subunit